MEKLKDQDLARPWDKIVPYLLTKREKEEPPAHLREMWERFFPNLYTRRIFLLLAFPILLGAKIWAKILRGEIYVPVPWLVKEELYVSNLLLIILAFWYLTTFVLDYTLRKQPSASRAESLYARYFIFELILITWFVHLIGGSEWVGAMIYIFTIIYANINLPKEKGIFVSQIAILLYASLVILEYFGIIPHREFFKVRPGLYQNINYTAATILFVGGICYLVTRATGIFSKALKDTSDKLARANRRLEMLANTDGLTNLWNHRYFQQSLEREIARAKRYTRPLSLIMLDIDWFKNYNDRYGHPKGDLVLKEIAEILTKNLRQIDIGARYGGEELAIILPESDRRAAQVTAERIGGLVESHPFLGDQTRKVKITASLGVATYPDDAKNRPALIEKADQALYRAKEKGRNRVEIA